MADVDPRAELQDLMAQVERHREALLEYRLSAYPEMVELHRAKLRELSARVRRHCAEHGLKVPPVVQFRAE